MFDVNITYFEVGADIVIDRRHGHLVRLAYNLNLEADFDDIGPLVRNCDFIEQIVFRLEWKRYINGEYILLQSREQSVYPTRRFKLNKENRRAAKCFLDKDFLKIEPRFPEAAELFCRISLHPVLASTKKTLDYSSGNLDTMKQGDSTEFDRGSSSMGYEY